MKYLNVSFALVLTLATAAAVADTSTPAPSPSPSPTPSLADDMKRIAGAFKSISAAVNDPSKNAQSAASAKLLVTLFTAAQGQVPDSITKLPSVDQEAAIADYKGLLQKEIDAALVLVKDFESGNNADAAAILPQMTATKKVGHGKYEN